MGNLHARNEILILAPVSRVWAIITDIDMLPKINPGILKVTGNMDKLGETRTCEIMTGGKKGMLTERLTEVIHEKKITWSPIEDTLNLTNSLIAPRFCFQLESIDVSITKLMYEAYYSPSSNLEQHRNLTLIKQKVEQIQEFILKNIKRLAENSPA